MPESKPSGTKKAAKKGLGRGLGSLLGAPAENEPAASPKPKVEPQKPTPKDTAKVVSKVEFKEKTEPAIQQGFHEATTKAKTKELTKAPTIPETQRIWQIPIEKLKPHSEQPRKHFETESLKELADSIKEQGILQPIVARKHHTGDFEIIAGERRWRAAQQAMLERVPVILKSTDEQTARELALVENIQRQDLNPIEEAEAFDSLIRKFKLTQQELADRLGKDRVSITNSLRLLKLNPELRDYLKSGELSQGHAKVLLSLEDHATQKKIGVKVLKQKLSVRATEKLVARAKLGKVPADEAEGLSDEFEVSNRLASALAQELQKRLKTRVVIDYNKGRGKLKINFHSDVELNQIVDKLKQ